MNGISKFEQLMHCETKGHPYWIDRELSSALGYSSYQKFKPLIDKSKEQIEEEGLCLNHHINPTVKMVEIGSGAYRPVKINELSSYACKKITDLADATKGQVREARSFFSDSYYDLDGDSVKYLSSANSNEELIIKKKNHSFWKKLNTEASQFYIKKMEELAEIKDLRRDDTFLLHKAPNHMMYKLETIERKDVGRAYEFLVEYEVHEPTVGIYFGCKGLILDGNDEHQIEEFNKEWEILKLAVTFYLNSTFPGKDFQHRFKPTNNSNNHTYWPFWITLYEDEDIREVAYRAIVIIRKVYKQYFDNNKIIDHKDWLGKNSDGKLITKTAFTHEAYLDLEKSTDSDLLRSFISRLKAQKLLAVSEIFEEAYFFTEEGGRHFQLEVALLFSKFFKEVVQTNNTKRSKKTPWENFCRVFLDKDGNTFSAASLRNQYQHFNENSHNKLCNIHLNNVDAILKKINFI